MNALRTFQPFAPDVLFRRARPADFLEPAMQRSLRESDLEQREAERDCYRQIHGHAAVIQMASHGRIGREHAQVIAWSDEAAKRAHVGCSSDCYQGRSCNCSHSTAWSAPRQPRKQESWLTVGGLVFATLAVGVILLGVWLY